MTVKSGRVTLAAALTAGGILAAGVGGLARAEFLQQFAAPSFVYGHGAQGMGFYPAAQQAAPRAAAAPRASSGTAPRRHREFGTGRSVNLAKPWLNQFR